MLKEMNVPVAELSRFTTLNRIDDILDLLAEAVRKLLTNSEIQYQNAIKARGQEQKLVH